MKMKNTPLQEVGRPSFVSRSRWTLLKLGIRLGMMAACVLILAPFANTQQTRPPLKGGVKYERRGGKTQPPLKGRVEQSKGICEGYGADINPFEGRLHVVPKTAQGSRYYCYVSFPNWRLLGEDGNYCCYFAPHEWAPKIPPTPGNATPDDPTWGLGCRGTYTECFGHQRRPVPGKPTPKPKTKKSKTKPTPKPTPTPTLMPTPTPTPTPNPTPTPTPSPTPTPTPPAMHCSDQVEVLSFIPRPLSGFVSHVGRPLPPHPFAGLWIMSLFSGRQFAGERVRGITFEARVWIKEGLIPINNIHIRYIQNVTQWDGSIFYSHPPHLRATLSCGSLPILDLGTRDIPREPFYTVGFRETHGNGPSRTVTVSDSPHLDNIVILRPDGSQTAEINVGASYTTYLGCVIGDDVDGSTWETLRELEWKLRYKGKVISTGGHTPYDFEPDSDAGLGDVGQAVPSNTIPTMIVGNDTFNRCQGFQEVMP